VNNRAIKSLIFGVAVLLFSLLLVFIGFLYLLSGVAGSLNAMNSSTGQVVFFIVVAAFVVGAAGLVIAYMGFAGTDKNQP